MYETLMLKAKRNVKILMSRQRFQKNANVRVGEHSR